MDANELKNIETEVFLNAVRYRFGYDFTGYARASIRRRVESLRVERGVPKIADLIPWVLHGEGALETVLAALSVPVTEMFRDPEAFAVLREKVIPQLAKHQRIRIWQAGSATGEEAYSLSILMIEAGLQDRTQIYATDINDRALATARDAIYPLERMKLYAENYRKSGGTRDFSDYYVARYGGGMLSQQVRENVYFSHHNLVTDGSFNEFQLVVCRNVLIYLDCTFQDRVMQLIRDSMCNGGYLCLGTKETIRATGHNNVFQPLSVPFRVYQFQQDRVGV